MRKGGYPKGVCVTCGNETSTCYTPQCRSCYQGGRQPTQESIEKQKKIVSDYNRKYALNHKAELRVYKLRQYHRQSEDEKRNKRFKALYGIDVQEFEALYMIQHGKCGICEKFLGHDRKKMCLDHNHKTGEVRLILCSPCNSGLGFFKENIESLRSAIEYLGGK